MYLNSRLFSNWFYKGPKINYAGLQGGLLLSQMIKVPMGPIKDR